MWRRLVGNSRAAVNPSAAANSPATSNEYAMPAPAVAVAF
eukprot:CAMPEP_0119506436 /NCGR_PEP_ID=MMETSP1344-20130328/26659_1 /TAXON_ID=236787 /ORGANISM="Florenciella parvula, Strain CCMP2471" /LENGTH=39 /DNA_ID= /DNA_START= /DNA_END= /DNA_ORIENTATION=